MTETLSSTTSAKIGKTAIQSGGMWSTPCGSWRRGLADAAERRRDAAGVPRGLCAAPLLPWSTARKAGVASTLLAQTHMAECQRRDGGTRVRQPSPCRKDRNKRAATNCETHLQSPQPSSVARHPSTRDPTSAVHSLVSAAGAAYSTAGTMQTCRVPTSE